MKVTNVIIRKIEGKKNLVGFADIVLNKSLVIHNVAIFLKEKGYCLGMPVKKYKGENKDVVHPLNTEFRNKLTNAVIEKLKEGDKNKK